MAWVETFPGEHVNIATDPTLPDVNSVGTLAKIDFRKFWNRVLESMQEERGEERG